MYISVAVGDFSARGCCPKKFIFFSNAIEYGASFSLLFNFIIRLKKKYFGTFAPKRILLFVSVGRSQKLNFVT